VSLEHLWAGWRGEYVTSVGTVEPAVAGVTGPAPSDDPNDCVFCRLASSGPPSAENGIVWIGTETFVVLNAYPYATGHLMVLPRRHVGALAELTAAEGPQIWEAMATSVAALEAAFGPDGMNLGANLGRAAGAGIPRHLHFHAVPRWFGDTNFMTAVAGTRVLPETLAVTWERLREAWPE
jgi:diadenosine tetraphosphate (Ap4A) HIT family hydrolase